MTGPDPALLADLDAGLLDPARAEEVRTAALADPRAAAVLDALRAARADLAALPAPPVPPAVRLRWQAALAVEAGVHGSPGGAAASGRPVSGTTPAAGATRPASGSAATGPAATASGPAAPNGSAAGDAASPRPAAAGPATRAPGSPVSDLTAGPVGPHAAHPISGRAGTGAVPPRQGSAAHPGRPTHQPPRGQSTPGPDRPRVPRSLRRRATVTALVAAAALVVGTVVATAGGRGSAVDVTRVELATVARSTIGVSELGVYTDPARRADCLGTAGHPGASVLGGRPVRLDGSPGVLMVLTTGVLGRFRVLVVDDTCRTLADDVVGR
ncbi:hypothetical protein [Pseudonocardia sp.]|uniref:hypothetical protein n=1 Tax=Pseudonocardia sp. TaxID=60912 RepID=UPI00261E5815|nr:hypothetical protein [Pseudonocardia sp.]